MSKPSIRPETGLRAPSSRVSAETPAMSRPRRCDGAHVAARRHVARCRERGRRRVGLQAVRRDHVRAGRRGGGRGGGRRGGRGGEPNGGWEAVSSRRRPPSSRPPQAGSRPARRAPRACAVGGGSPVLLQSLRDAPPGAQRGEHARQQPERAGQRQPAAGPGRAAAPSGRSSRPAARPSSCRSCRTRRCSCRAPCPSPARPRPPSCRSRRGCGSACGPRCSRTTGVGRGPRMPGSGRAR